MIRITARQRCLILLPALMFLTNLVRGEELRPVGVSTWTQTPPVLDGNPDEPIWSKARVYQASGLAFRACSDGQWLYLAIDLTHPDPSSLPTGNLGRDKVRWEETAEVFIAPDPNKAEYYHFAIEPSGTDYDTVGIAPATDYHFSWRHVEKITETGWRTEMALPLKELGLAEGVKRGDIVHLNVCRSTKSKSGNSSWSPTGGSFHNREAFGVLVIGSFEEAARRQAVQLGKEVQAGLQKAKKQKEGKNCKGFEGLGLEVRQLLAGSPKISTAKQWWAFESRMKELSQQSLELSGNPDRPLVVWSVNPWDLPKGDVIPATDEKRVETLEIRAFQGEYVTLALGVANLSSKAIRLRCVPGEWVSPGAVMAPETHLTVRKVVEVALKGGYSQRDALPELKSEDEVCVLPRTNEILWLTIDTHDLNPGMWMSQLTLLPLVRHDFSTNIQLQMKVLPAVLPQGPRPYSCNWAEYEYPPFNRWHAQKYNEDQKKHYTNLHIVRTRSFAPSLIKFDEKGQPINEPNFSDLDRAIDRFGETGQFYVLNVQYPIFPEGLGGKDNLDDPVARKNFAWYVAKVRQHFQKRGLGVRDFAWYGADEPDLKKAEEVAKFGKLLQAADPEQQIFVTVYQAQQVPWLKIMAPYVNIWVAKLNLTDEQKTFIFSQKARFFSYTVNSRTACPYRSYRLESMLAWVNGCESVGFWRYDDAGDSWTSSTWIDDSGNPKRPIYAAIYEGQDGPVPSVRWEAWRQGIQDWRYVEWMRDLASECPSTELARQAQALVEEAPRAILRSPEKTTADRYMKQIAETLTRLLIATGKISNDQLELMNQTSPVCLTGNSCDGRFDDYKISGSYTYSVFPNSRPENAGVKQGAVFFRGADAVTGVQKENRVDGSLTDGKTTYPDSWIYLNGLRDPLIVTFDLKGRYKLSFCKVYMDLYPCFDHWESFRVLISDSADDANWQEVEQVYPFDQPNKGFRSFLSSDRAIQINLHDRQAQKIRFEFQTKHHRGGLGEIKIFGWPISEASKN